MRRGPERRVGPRGAALRWVLAAALCGAGVAGASPEGPALQRAERGIAPAAPPRWRGGILFDDAVRAQLRAPAVAVRAHAATASDVLLRACVAFPLLACALHLSLLRRRVARATAARLLLAGVLALSLTGLVHRAVSRAVGRERPYVQECGRGAPPPECARGPEAARVSFYSGHAAVAFTALGLAGLQVRSLGLRGTLRGGVLQALARLAAVAMALLRVVADRHYASDVLAGALLGLGAALLAGRLCGLGAAINPQAPARRGAAGRLPAPSSAPEGH